MLRLRFPISEFLACLVVVTFFFGPKPPGADPGIGWHLRNGEVISTTLQIPRMDPFLSEARPWVNNQWLGDILLHQLYAVAGWPGLQLLVVCVGWLIAFYLTPKVLQSTSPFLRLFGGLIVLCLLIVQWFVRPVQFSFLFLALLFVHLRRSQMSVYLPLFFCLWANIHPGFFLGLILLSLRIAVDAVVAIKAGKGIRSLWRSAVIFLLSVAATTLNPSFTELHSSALGLIGSNYFQSMNSEWLPPKVSEAIFWPFFIALPLIFLALFSRPDHFTAAVTIALTLLSFKSGRYIPFLSLPAAVLICEGVQNWLDNFVWVRRSRFFSRSPQPASLISFLLLCLFATLTLLQIPGIPLARATLLSAAKLPEAFPELLEECSKVGGKTVYSTPNFGGAITFISRGAVRAILDDRNELLGESAYRSFFTIIDGKDGWEEEIRRISPDCLLLSSDMAVDAKIQKQSSWIKLRGEKQLSLYWQKSL